MVAARTERKKAFVIAMMLLMVTLSGLGALLWSADSVSATGDHNSAEWIIDYDLVIGSNLPCQANIMIVDGGSLTIRNAELQMASGTSGNLTIVVGYGGSLILDNASITAYPHTFDAEMTLGILVENGGLLKMTDSALTFPGHLVVDNARLEMHSSSIQGISTAAADRAHSPVFMGFSADVVMVDSLITDIFTGDDPATAYFNHTFATETALRQTVEYNVNRYPASVTFDPDNLTKAFNPGSYYLLPGGEEAVFDGFDLGGLVFDADEYDLHLNVHYRTVSGDFDDPVSVEYGRDGVFGASGIVINNTWTVDNKNPLQKAKEDITNYSSVELSTMQVAIDNTDAVGIQIERLFVSIEGIAVDSYRNITMAGDSSFLAIDSILPINFNVTVDERNALVLMDSSQAYFYGVTFEDPDVGDAPHGRAVDFIDRTFTALPLEKTANDTTGSAIQNLFETNTNFYEIPAETQMEIMMNLTGLLDREVSARILTNSVTNVEGPYLNYSIGGENYTSLISPELLPSYQNYSIGNFSTSELSGMLLSLENNQLDTSAFDSIFLEIVYSPKLHIYKWANVTVENSLGSPIHGATLNAKEQVGGAVVSYLPDDGDTSVPPQEVLDHLGRTNADFNVTDADGKALIPLLTGTHSNRGDTYHTWEITAVSAPNLYVLGSNHISFGAYPYLSPELNDDTVVSFSLEANAAELELSDPYLVRTSNKTMLAVDITNVGDADSYAFNTTFIINGSAMAVNNANTSLAINETVTFMQEFVQSEPGELLVEALVTSDDGLIDGENSSADLTVNIVISDFFIDPPTTSNLQYGDDVFVFYEIIVLGNITVTDVKVEIFYSESPGATPVSVYRQDIPALSPGIPWRSGTSLDPAIHSQSLPSAQMTYSLVVNNGGFVEGGIPESDYDDNIVNATFTYVDPRPLLVFEAVDTPVKAPFGKTVDIGFTVNNTGGTTGQAAARVTMYLVDGSDRIQIVNTTTTSDGTPIEIAGSSVFQDSVSWKVNVPEGNYTLEAFVNEFGVIDVRDDADNSLTTFINVDALEPAITVAINRLTFNSGEQMIVTGIVTNKNDASRLSGQSVSVAVFRDGVKVAEQVTITNAQGFYLAEITATDNMGGQIEVRSTVNVGDESSSATLIASVKPAVSVTDQPIWVWLLIIAILIAIIAAFTVYVYRYSLGKMAECGECHSLIPEAARRCPNCGTDFETGTAKCSECNSWIPASSTSCPECSASFVGGLIIDEKESEYVQLMREGYESFVDGYREKVREDLGKKYSDTKFIGIWKEHPEYISFEDWLAREEGKRTEKTFPCPSCGTPNVEGSKSCYRCGNVFEPPQEDSARRVVRRESTEEKPEIKTDAAPRKKVVVKRKAPEAKAEPEEMKESPEKSEESGEKAEGEPSEKATGESDSKKEDSEEKKE